MEADQSFKHICKICQKKFRCGRSLGGHMRSHLMNTETEFSTSLSRVNNGENPKRNARNPKRFCRECGRGFQSWKALFGHMKCHSEKKKSSIKIEDRESWSFENQKMMIMGSQSDTEFSAPNRKKRSSRRRLRYSKSPPPSVSIANVSEIDQEQEEIALSLIMLSRDNGPWGRINSTSESSEDISDFSQVRFFDSNDFVLSKPNFKLGEMDSGNLEFLGKQSESKKIRVKKKSEFDDRVGMKTSDNTKLGKNMTDEVEKCSSHENYEGKFRSKIRKISKIQNPDSESYRNLHKRKKFECSSCRKVFPSYQALGGHKTSHRRIKSCLEATMEVEENITEIGNENQIDPEIVNVKSKRKMHSCPICFKLFSSGQALGGHKRSHLVGCSENTNNQTIATGEKIPGIRGFLDLNLPAAVDEESNNSSFVASLDPWWVRGMYGSEWLLSLISN